MVVAIEEIENNKYFMKIAHFTGEISCFSSTGKVKCHNMRYPFNIEFINRSCVIPCPSPSVKNMLAIIKKEASGQIPVPKLNVFGKGSVFFKKREDSCITWSLDKLEIAGIEVKKKADTFFLLTSEFTPIPYNHSIKI